MSDGGWDNDNFLESLGRSVEDQTQANDDYYRVSRYGRPEEEQQTMNVQQQTYQQQQPWGGQNSNDNSINAGNQAQTYNAPLQQQPGLPAQDANQVGYAGPMNAFSQQVAQLQQQQQQQLQELQRQQQQQLQELQRQQQQQFQQNFQQQQQLQQNLQQQQHLQQSLQQQQFEQQQNVQMPQQYGQGQATQNRSPFTDGEDIPSTFPNSASEDELPTEDIEGAVITDEMKAKMKASHTKEEEESQGGQMFRNLMSRAKVKANQQQHQQSAQRQISNVQIPANAESLSIEEQARLFREIMMQRQQQQQQQQQVAMSQPPNPYQQQVPQIWDPYPQQYPQQQPQSNSYAQMQLPNYPYSAQSQPPQFLPKGIGPDGRKIGRNKDADVISTAADVYLAKLKRDSTSRRIARDAGDDVKANAIFHDPSLNEISAPVNPYLEEQRERERNMLETVPEEMLIFQEYGGEANEETRSYSGISFKEKLAQAKQRKSGGSGTL